MRLSIREMESIPLKEHFEILRRYIKEAELKAESLIVVIHEGKVLLKTIEDNLINQGVITL
jgi:hypothetical protein